jgi:hypothetical protein
MATSTGTSASWDNDTNQLLQLIADALENNSRVNSDLPGLKSLLDDYLDENVDVGKVDFHRRMLQVFKRSTSDHKYEELLEYLTPDEKHRVENFVDGKEELEDIADGFEIGFSLGSREHIKDMIKTNSVTVSAAGPVHIDGLSHDELKMKDKILYKFVHGLWELFHCFHRDIEDEQLCKDEVVVSSPLSTPTTDNGQR